MDQTKLSEIMTVNLVTVTPDTTMDKVEEIFKSHNFHHLPVIDEHEKLVGIISKGDYYMLCDKMTLFREKFDSEFNMQFMSSLLASEVMNQQVAKLRPTDSIELAVSIFKENLFHAIPIVDSEDVLKGMVTTFDLMNFAFNQPPSYLITAAPGIEAHE